MIDISNTASMTSVPQQIGLSMATYFLLVFAVVLITRSWLHSKIQRPVTVTDSGSKPLPGPRGIPVLGNMLSLGRTAPNISLMKLAKQYGNIFQIRLGSRKILVLNGYEAIHKAFVKQSLIFAGRPNLYTFNLIESHGSYGPSLSFSTYSESWKLHRKLAESSLRHFTAGSQTKFVESVVTSEASELVRYLSENCRESSVENAGTDMGSIIRLSVSNIMCWYMTSKRHSYDNQVLRKLLLINDRFSQATGSGNPADFLPWLRYLLKKSISAFETLLIDFNTFMNNLVHEHHKDYKPGSERDILDHLLTSGHRNEAELAEHGLTAENLLQTAGDFFGAGFETVSTTLEWSMIYMAAYPEVQAEIQRELDAVVGRDRLPNLADRCNLPYTQSCLLEILRHATVVPFAIPHSTTDDTTLDGYFVPKDTVVFANLYSVHYDPDTWNDPETFDPRRFLAPDGTLDQLKKNQIIPFSVGRRRCVGSDLARIELFLYFTAFLHRLSFVNSGKGPVSFEAVYGLTRRAKEFNIQIIPRS